MRCDTAQVMSYKRDTVPATQVIPIPIFEQNMKYFQRFFCVQSPLARSAFHETHIFIGYELQLDVYVPQNNHVRKERSRNILKSGKRYALKIRYDSHHLCLENEVKSIVTWASNSICMQCCCFQMTLTQEWGLRINRYFFQLSKLSGQLVKEINKKKKQQKW